MSVASRVTLWPGLCALLGLASALAWMLGNPASLAWSANAWTQRPWVLWSASLTHLSGAHLLGNLVALLVLALLGAYLQAAGASAIALVLAWPLGTLALSLWPQLAGYSGLSGLLCAMLAVLWVHATYSGSTKPASYVLFAVLVLKLLNEHAWSQPIGFDPHWGFNVVYAAHLTGAVAGALCGLLCTWVGDRWRA